MPAIADPMKSEPYERARKKVEGEKEEEKPVEDVSKNEKSLSEWLKEDPDLLNECRKWYNEKPEWWSIAPDNTLVFYRSKEEVLEIRKMPGESGGHHPHGLALGGPKGQKLTKTNETVKCKNETHTKVTVLQRKVINKIKKQLNGE